MLFTSLFRGGKRIRSRTLNARLLLQPLEDRLTPSTFTVTNTNDSGTGSLRAAITDANNHAGADVIDFEIEASGAQTINLKSALPTITGNVTIDGYTQGTSPGDPLIDLNGSTAGSTTNGLVVDGAGSLIEGLTINSFGDDGMVLEASGCTVLGCFIGVNPALTALPNKGDGIAIESSDNHIGGSLQYQGNIISGNHAAGVYIGGSSAQHNSIEGNFIGTDATGNILIGNGYGVAIRNKASLNTIGGVSQGDGNLISGNSVDGVLLQDTGVTGNVVAGNRIGTNNDEIAAIPNDDGILVGTGASGNQIGAQVAPGANVISGNDYAGIELTNNSTKTQIEGNFIGTNSTTNLAIPNDEGIEIYGSSTTITIGGASAAYRNIISGNTNYGIQLTSGNPSIVGPTGILVEGNYIGTDATGITAIPNGGGVQLLEGSKNNTIGGLKPGDGNLISGNTGDGIDITGSGTTKNVVAGNIIGANPGQSAVISNLYGIVIENGASANTIGGTLDADDNVISGNGIGVTIQDQGTSNNIVEDNHIGTDSTGTIAIANQVGIEIFNGATNNVIGGTAPLTGNLISGNANYGIEIFDDNTSGNLVEGNDIGTDNAGTAALANDVGVIITSGATNNVIGGILGAAENTISGNTTAGVEIDQPWTTGNAVEHNFIGLNVSGTAAVPNGYGVIIASGASGNTIGGINAGNFISGNTDVGVFIFDSGTSLNSVQGNLIGVAVAHNAPLGNGEQGILIDDDASNNLIGGIPLGDGNVIADNGQDGVFIGGIASEQFSQPAGPGNAVLSNSIYGNAGLGINLGTGADSLAAPTLSSATLANGVLTLNGAISVATGEDLRVEVFANPSSASGNPQGETFLGAFTEQSGVNTSVNVVENLTTGQVQTGEVITVTITDQFGNTSEFSVGVVVS